MTTCDIQLLGITSQKIFYVIHHRHHFLNMTMIIIKYCNNKYYYMASITSGKMAHFDWLRDIFVGPLFSRNWSRSKTRNFTVSCKTWNLESWNLLVLNDKVIFLFTSSKDAFNLQFQHSDSCKFANFTCNLLRKEWYDKKGALATMA